MFHLDLDESLEGKLECVTRQVQEYLFKPPRICVEDLWQPWIVLLQQLDPLNLRLHGKKLYDLITDSTKIHRLIYNPQFLMEVNLCVVKDVVDEVQEVVRTVERGPDELIGEVLREGRAALQAPQEDHQSVQRCPEVVRDRADHDLSHLIDALQMSYLSLLVQAVTYKGKAVLPGELALL